MLVQFSLYLQNEIASAVFKMLPKLLHIIDIYIHVYYRCSFCCHLICLMSFQEKSIFSGMFKKSHKPAEGATTDEVQ